MQKLTLCHGLPTTTCSSGCTCIAFAMQPLCHATAAIAPASASAADMQSYNNDVGLVSASPAGEMYPASAGVGGQCGGVALSKGQRRKPDFANLHGDKPARASHGILPWNQNNVAEHIAR